MWSAWQAIMGLNRRFNAGTKLPGAGSAAYGLRVSTRGKLEGNRKIFPAVLRQSRAVASYGGSCGSDCGAIVPRRRAA
jgi:hypothetical protein